MGVSYWVTDMSKKQNQKSKILYIQNLLFEQTDQEHGISIKDILAYLANNGIEAERKSIYNDINTLKIFGMDIICSRKNPKGYYIGSRDFEIAELKLLVDAVQSSKFITAKKSNTLIKKLEKLTSIHKGSLLQRQVIVADRIKTDNETIYYSIDTIHEAISQNKKIEFKYFEWTIKKDKKYRKQGQKYKISPWALIWCDDKYYLLGYDSIVNKMKHYRVDKMDKISLSEELRNGLEEFNKIDLAKYTTQTFCMFGGELTNVTIVFKNKYINTIIDRFGKDVAVVPTDNEHFKTILNIVVSNQFYGWVTGIEGKIEEPKNVAEKYKKYLSNLLAQF